MSKLSTRVHSADTALCSWRVGLLRGANGRIKANLANAIAFLEHAPDLAGMLSYQGTQRVMARGGLPWAPQPHEWNRLDDIRLVEWLQRHGCAVGKTIARQAVLATARDRCYAGDVGV